MLLSRSPPPFPLNAVYMCFRNSWILVVFIFLKKKVSITYCISQHIPLSTKVNKAMLLSRSPPPFPLNAEYMCFRNILILVVFIFLKKKKCQLPNSAFPDTFQLSESEFMKIPFFKHKGYKLNKAPLLSRSPPHSPSMLNICVSETS